MKNLLVIILVLIPLSSQADFSSGMVVGMMMANSEAESNVIQVKDGGKPCLISLKSFQTPGETFNLNANYIQEIADWSFETNCKSSGLFSKTCQAGLGSRIFLINQDSYKSTSSVNDIKEQIKSCNK